MAVDTLDYNDGYSSSGSAGGVRARAPALSIDVGNANRGRISPAQQKIETRAAQVHQVREYEISEAEAHSMMEDESPGSSGDEVAEGLRVRNGEAGDHDQDEHMQDDQDDSGSFSDSLSSSPSIPDEDIDFGLVYALHTFLATVDGQASVVKGDKLLLLDDSNSYWWLVRVLKTQAVGYIPAENIETPFERLARLNKHRNVDLTSATQQDVVTGPSSTAAQTRFDARIPPSQQPHPHKSQHPSSKGIIASPSHKDHPRNISPSSDRPERSGSSKAKTVIFTAPTYYEHSANGETDEEDYDEEMDGGEEGELQGDQVFDDDDEGEESEFSDDNLTEEIEQHEGSQSQVNARRPVMHHPDEADDGGDEEDLTRAQWEEERARNVQAQRAEMESTERQQQRAASPRQQQQELLHKQQREQQYQQEQQQLRQQQLDQQALQAQRAAEQADMQRKDSDANSNARRPSDSSTRSRDLDLDAAFDPNAPTKKLTTTPPIVRDPTFDINNPFGDLPPAHAPSSPQRVHGVDIIDPKDPRYNKLISERRPDFEPQPRRPSGDSGYNAEGEVSFNSIETASSSAPLGSDEGHGSRESFSSSSTLKKKKGGRESVDGEGEKKRKSGGILGGLFRKKDKKKKDTVDDARSSEESSRASPSPVGRPSSGITSPRTSGDRAPAGKRESQTAESMFSTDAALRQQQVEAKQALYHQYGVQRGPGDVSNTMTPRNNALLQHQQNLSPTTGGFNGSPQANARMRPGSLIGSPSIPGLDVLLLSVLRVFAGDNIESEATFKTVLLNRSTSTSDLVKQAMQRFRLAGLEDRDEYFLTVKELGGDERPLLDAEKPLIIFENLADTAEGSGFAVPSVKRSSIGSISSISSSLSLNPAITRLGMNDFSDDSAVKFYLNRRPAENLSPLIGDTASPATTTGPPGIVVDQFTPTSSPSFRFAVRLLIYPDDLPENVIFDPQTNAIIPRSAFVERQQRAGLGEIQEATQTPREKIIFFPRNVNVSEVIEAGLDRFGIVDGVVDGGDEVEDRVSKRRSVSRVKYGLAVERGGQETLLNSSGKVLEAYSAPPLFKPYDRTLKEFRRRSVDATLILGTPQDLQPADPVFIIRRAAHRLSGNGQRSLGPLPIIVDELALQQQQLRPTPELARPDRPTRSATAASAASGVSIYTTPAEELDEDQVLARAAASQATRQEIIAAQRAVSRANQRAIVSAQKNTEQGVDIVLPHRGMIRSSRTFANDRVRYSYIDQDGSEMDISDIVENEWAAPEDEDYRSSSRASELTVSGASNDGDSFITARGSPTSQLGVRTSTAASTSTEEDDEEERLAINALRSTSVLIDGRDASSSPTLVANASPSKPKSLKLRPEGSDVLEDALGTRSVTSPMFSESLQDRLDRVLAKVREDKARGTFRSRSAQGGGSGRASPLVGAGRLSPSQGRRSPYGGRDSPSIDQIMQERANSRAMNHSKKPSVASVSSTSTDVPSTPVTGGSNAASSSFTPNSSSESRASNHRPPVIYRDDFGLDTLMTIVDADSHRRSTRPKRDVGVDGLFGQSMKDVDVHPEVRSWYDAPAKAIDDIDARLDALLLQFVST